MRFTIERTALLRTLGHVIGLVEKRNTMPILANVLFIVNNDTGVTVKATDLDMEAVETAPATVSQPGSATISAHTLHDIVRKLPDGSDVQISRSDDGSRLKVGAGRAKFELSILPADDFPDMGEADLPHRFEIGADELKRLFEKTRFAISTEETRYYLNGIYLHPVAAGGGETKLRAVATDGHRLAQAETACPSGAEGMPGVIVPRKAVNEVVKLLEGQNSVTVALSSAKIRFTIGDMVLTSKLIDGSFPDYGRVIPTNNKRMLRVENAGLVKAVDRVSTLSSEKGRAVKFGLGDGLLVISANSPMAGSASEEMHADYSSEPFEIGFNAKYVLDITAHIAGTHAEFQLGDASSPTLISDDGDPSALYVLMPMRV